MLIRGKWLADIAEKE